MSKEQMDIKLPPLPLGEFCNGSATRHYLSRTQAEAYARQAVLADRQARPVVAWRYWYDGWTYTDAGNPQFGFECQPLCLASVPSHAVPQVEQGETE